MGNCTSYCNSCGDEGTQINTLDQSQLKHSIRDKESNGENFINRYAGSGQMQQQEFGSGAVAGGQFAQEGEQMDDNGRITRGPVTLKNGAVYTGQWLNGVRDGFGSQMWPDGSKYEG